VEITTRDLATPSPLSHAILNARPFAFLDDGAAEERRTKAVRMQPIADLQTAQDVGRLDPKAIAQVRADAWPEIGNAEELHDALVVHGFLTDEEASRPDLVEALAQQRRVTRLRTPAGSTLLVAAERLHELRAILPKSALRPPLDPVSSDRPEPEDALREILRGRLDLLGPVTADALGAPLGLEGSAVQSALLQLEAEGAVMRGGFTDPAAAEWCDRRLLARIHRMTRDTLRAEIQPLPPAQFMRFLFRWHQLAGSEGDERRQGEGGLADVLRQLEGHAAPASAWEEDLLPARVHDYMAHMLDKLCAVGRIAWWRPAESGEAAGRKSGPIRGTPVLLCERESMAHWQQAVGAASPDESVLSGSARLVLDLLRAHGASFFADLQRDARLLGTQVEQALSELVAHGLVTCDSFAGLRTLVMPADKRNKLRRKHRDPIDDAGRWSLTRRPRPEAPAAGALAAPHVEHIARVLLRRYGVVFRKLLEREEGLPPWRELYYVLRRLEARGEVRGGRFVSGFSGEQFALPEAAAALRKTAKTPGRERISLSAVDPLNLAGILTPGDKVPRLPGNRVLFEGGVPIATQSGSDIRYLQDLEPAQQWEVKNLLIRRQRPASYVEPPPVLS
jgi:ATP-dependent Lhr-like helicase